MFFCFQWRTADLIDQFFQFRNSRLFFKHGLEFFCRQFAVYMKMHHAAIDGVGSMQLTEGICSTDPGFRTNDSAMSKSAYERYLKSVQVSPARRVVPKERELRNVADALKQQFNTSAHLLGALRSFGGAFFGRSGNLTVPWHNVPRTSINTQVSGARRFVAQS